MILKLGMLSISFFYCYLSTIFYSNLNETISQFKTKKNCLVCLRKQNFNLSFDIPFPVTALVFEIWRNVFLNVFQFLSYDLLWYKTNLNKILLYDFLCMSRIKSPNAQAVISHHIRNSETLVSFFNKANILVKALSSPNRPISTFCLFGT